METKIEKNSDKDTSQEKYDLYTEKVVIRASKRYKWLIRILEVIAVLLTILALTTAGLLYFLPTIQDRAKRQKEEREKEIVYIQKDNYNYFDDQYSEDDEKLTEKDLKENYEQAMSILRSQTEDVQKSIVIVDNKREISETPTVKNDNNINTEICGLIVARANGKFMILTSDNYLDMSGQLIVKISPEGSMHEAKLECDNSELGMCIISISESDFDEKQISEIKVCELDNSYRVHQGDLVIAAGSIYGSSKASDYGTVVGTNIKYATDNGLGIIETNVASNGKIFSFLFNSYGRVVGISDGSEGATIKAIGISDIKATMETMLNKHSVRYCGIIGQNVTEELAKSYNLPDGIYVSSVDIDSPAYYSGLQTGDVITGVNGQDILTIQQFNEKLNLYNEGESLQIKAKRLGKDGYTDVSFVVMVKLKKL